MRKSDKKKDRQITKVLTDACESHLKNIPGFMWLTHLINYAHFPKSLRVICVFDTNDNLNKFLKAPCRHDSCTLIQRKLFEISVDIDSTRITFDSEENCSSSHDGSWSARLTTLN